MIAVVIPCYRVKRQILGVLSRVGPECGAIYVVDDGCPEATGNHVEEECRDSRVHVLRHSVNQGVGAATLTGYRAALEANADIVVECGISADSANRDAGDQEPVPRIAESRA